MRNCLYVLRFTFYVLRFTFYVLRFTFYVLRFTFYVLRFTFYILRLIYGLSTTNLLPGGDEREQLCAAQADAPGDRPGDSDDADPDRAGVAAAARPAGTAARPDA